MTAYFTLHGWWRTS
ncbi:trp operon leader peptide [Enterobacter roggenkampii]